MNKHFIYGFKASLPACMGVIPVGISFGLLAIQTGLTAFEACFMSATVMAGSSQLLALGLLQQGAGFPTIVLGTFFINLRHLVMSASVFHHLLNIPLVYRMLGAFGVCDESFAVYSLSGQRSFQFLVGSNTALYVSFLASTILGTVMTDFLPQVVIHSFNIAFYAALISLLIPAIKNRLPLMALVLGTAILNALLQTFLPGSWSILIAMVMGAFVGMIVIDEPAEKERT